MKLFFLSPFVSVVLTPILVVSPLWAQSPVSSGTTAVTEPSIQTLQLRLLASDNPKATVNSQSVKGFTLEVVDPTGAPVSEAAIAVRLPDSGPTGAFADGSHSTVAYTDKSGHAQISGIRWAETPGQVAMRVTATKGDSHAGMLIEQTLTAPAPAPTRVTTAPAASTVATAPPPSPAPPTIFAPQPAIARPVMPPPAQPLAPSPQPATPSVQVIAKNSAPAPVPGTTAASALAPQNGSAPAPTVSVSSPAPNDVPHHSHAKWYIIALVAAGAGVGVAMAGKGKSSSSTPTSSALSIGTPSLSVGGPHP